MAISYPLNSKAVGQADDVFYCKYKDTSYDGILFDSDDNRIPLGADGPVELRRDWCDMYEAILQHNAGGSAPFPDCGKGHVHHDPACPHCVEQDDPPEESDPEEEDDEPEEVPDEEPDEEDDPDSICEDCVETYLIVTVRDEDGNPVAASVDAGPAGAMSTSDDGISDFGLVPPGVYKKISAERDGHAPRRNEPVGPDVAKDISVPAGDRTKVDLIQHPICASVAKFEGPPSGVTTARSKWWGFDPKTDLAATAAAAYWNPVPEHGDIEMKGKFTQDGARWVSVPVGRETELEIEFDFKHTECIPCIENSTFEISPSSVAEVVTASIGAKKAAFKIKGKSSGEASLKVMCDGFQLGWFHIWCKPMATIKVDVGCIITDRAPAATFNVGRISATLNEVFRQAALNISVRSIGNFDLTGNPLVSSAEAPSFPAGGKLGQGVADATLSASLASLDSWVSATLQLRSANPFNTLPEGRSGAQRLYFYAPTVGAAWAGWCVNIGAGPAFVFKSGSTSIRNSAAHELGHSLGLRHPAHDDGTVKQYAPHNALTINNATVAQGATHTEAAISAASAHWNVLANDPANLMGYWSDKANRKPLRYHQWKALSRS